MKIIKKYRKIVVFVWIFIVGSVLAGVTPLKAQVISENEILVMEQEDSIQPVEEVSVKFSGTDGKVKWTIDGTGHLLLEGDGDYENDPDWIQGEYVNEIKSATVQVTNMTRAYRMFSGCTNLTSIDLSGFDTSNVTNMDFMFYSCNSLENLDLSGFDTGNVTTMWYMFYNCVSLKTLDVSGFNTSNVTNMQFMFEYCKSLENLDLSSFDTKNVNRMSHMFYMCSSLKSVDISSFDTSNVTHMSSMFFFCQSLTSLDVSDFNTSNVTDMSSMFSNCQSLTSLDVSGFDTSNVTDMSHMFSSCRSLISLDLSNFNTSNVTDMSDMFSYNYVLEDLKISGFDTSNVTDMSHMFHGCEEIEKLEVSHFNTSHVTDMGYMFYGCEDILELNLEGWNFSALENTAYVLNGLTNLVKLVLPDMSVEISLGGDFYDENGTLTSVSILNAGKKTYIDKIYAESYCGKNGHSYGEPIFIWTEDYKMVKARFECMNADCYYCKKVELAAAITTETIQPTTEKEGATVYTASVVFGGNTYTDIKSIPIPKLPQDSSKPNEQKTEQPSVEKPVEQPIGASLSVSDTLYRVSKSGQTPEVAYMGPKNKKVKKVTIPASVTIDGVTYKVTSVGTGALKNYKNLTTITIGNNVTKIDKNAFYGCKKLKRIVIKGKNLKSVGKNAFKGIKKNANIDVPNSKRKAYKKLFKTKTGYKKTMKVK